MFQFSTLLTRQDAGISRRRPSAANPQPVRLSAHDNADDSLASPADHCVSDRVRRDLDDQMLRLGELLDRVESLEFEREAEAAEIFSIGKTDWQQEPAGQPRIFKVLEGGPGTDNRFPAQFATAADDRAVHSTERAACDESMVTCVVLPQVIPLSTREVESLAAPSVICNSPGAAVLVDEPCTKPIALETRRIQRPVPVTEAPAPSSACKTSRSLTCRKTERQVASTTSECTAISSGVVQDYRPDSLRAILETTPAIGTSDTSDCVSLAAPDPGESLNRQCGISNYALTNGLLGKSESGTDDTTTNESADRPSFLSPIDIDSGGLEDHSSHAIEPCRDRAAPNRDDATPPFPNVDRYAPTQAADDPNRFAAPAFGSEPCASPGVHMLVVNDIPIRPTPSLFQASAPAHSRSPAQSALVEDTGHDLRTVSPPRSLRRTQSIETSRGSNVAPVRSSAKGSAVWNILAVIGGILTLAALAYVTSDLASWFGPVR